MIIIPDRLKQLRHRIMCAEQKYNRKKSSVNLLAVSKARKIEEILAAVAAGQRHFGENYLQEAIARIDRINNPDLVWHFIGPVQSNKTRIIAERFSWVHSIDRARIAQRLSDMRPPALPDLNICIQVNISAEQSKSGIRPEQLAELAQAVSRMPGLVLRGLMTMPAWTGNHEEQRESFKRLYNCYLQLRELGFPLDTLSMGTSHDMEAAIAEGATIIRIGTGVFGPRD
jgi:hypothetical protein